MEMINRSGRTNRQKLIIILLIINIYYSYGRDNNEINWRIIANSSDIYCVNSTYIKTNLETRKMREYSEINIPVTNVLKGEMTDKAVLQIYMDKEDYDFIYSLPDNSEMIIFLQKLYNHRGAAYGGGYNYFLADKITDSVIFVNENTLNLLIREIEHQERIISEQLYKKFAMNTGINNKIKKIISNITNRMREQKSLKKLEEFGVTGVPYIILALDDFRELPVKSISLGNKSSDAFEGIRHYGPYLAVDALAAILNQITGEHFGFIYNGDDTTDEQRRRCIKGWYIYLYYLIQ